MSEDKKNNLEVLGIFRFDLKIPKCKYEKYEHLEDVDVNDINNVSVYHCWATDNEVHVHYEFPNPDFDEEYSSDYYTDMCLGGHRFKLLPCAIQRLLQKDAEERFSKLGIKEQEEFIINYLGDFRNSKQNDFRSSKHDVYDLPDNIRSMHYELYEAGKLKKDIKTQEERI